MKKSLKHLVSICVTFTLAATAVATQHAFIWSSTAGMQDLGSLGGDSFALAINDSGEVAGYFLLADNVTTHAFTWTSATGMVDLGPIPGGSSSQATAINSAGDVVGAGFDANGVRVPFYWSPSGGFVTLPENSGNALNYAFGINDASEVTGQRYVGQVVSAFRWSPSSGAYATIAPLPLGLHTVGNDINNLRHLTGTGSRGSGFDALFWSKTTGTRDIGKIAGQSYTAGAALNDHDEVVGFAGGDVNTGFYWSRSTGMIILQTLGGAKAGAFGINESSAIAGYGTTSGGATHAALWPDKNSAPQDLGTLPGGANSYARAINGSGLVVGYADVP